MQGDEVPGRVDHQPTVHELWVVVRHHNRQVLELARQPRVAVVATHRLGKRLECVHEGSVGGRGELGLLRRDVDGVGLLGDREDAPQGRVRNVHKNWEGGFLFRVDHRGRGCEIHEGLITEEGLFLVVLDNLAHMPGTLLPRVDIVDNVAGVLQGLGGARQRSNAVVGHREELELAATQSTGAQYQDRDDNCHVYGSHI